MKKYLVGGAVRNKILNIPITERDWVVIGATPQEMIEMGYEQVGRNFPVFLHPKSREEYALARTEYKSSKGYTGFTCYTSPRITLEEDLRRRDLTINAIACDSNGLLIDPFNGQKDINNRWLRHVSDAFIEDPLRVLRVARFAASFLHLGFRIKPETLSLMKNMTNELTSLSPERIWKETEKALSSRNPQTYFEILRSCKALKILFPEIDILFEIPDSIKYSVEINTGIHSLMSLSIASKLSNDVAVRFSSLYHDVGKSMTPNSIWPNHPNHNLYGLKIIEDTCKRLKISNSLRDLAKISVKYHNLVHNIKHLTSKTLIKLLNSIDVWRKPYRLNQIIHVSESDMRGHVGFEEYIYFQGNFLREAFHVASSVTAYNISKCVVNGENINKKLNKDRQKAIDNWRKNII